MKLACSIIFCLFLSYQLVIAQEITGIGTVWSDDFREWVLLSEEEEVGNLEMRWKNQNDWSNWDFRIGELTGTIEQKWRNNPNEWELRGNNEIVSARTLVRGNFREWRITNNDIQLTLKTKYGNISDEWELRIKSYGNFEMLTVWEGDPREWVIIDKLNNKVPFNMKMAIFFVVIYSSTPK